MARALDELEERVAALLAEHLADERAENPDIVAKRHILGRELRQEPSAAEKSRTAATPQAARSTDARPSPPTAIASPFCSTRLVRRACLKAYAAGHSPTG